MSADPAAYPAGREERVTGLQRRPARESGDTAHSTPPRRRALPLERGSFRTERAELPVGGASSGTPPGGSIAAFQELNTAVQELNTASQELNTAVQELNTASQELNTAVQELNTASQELITASQELNTASQELNTASQELNTASQELNTASQELITASRELIRRLPKPEMGVCAAENRVGPVGGSVVALPSGRRPRRGPLRPTAA
ncbi:MAG: hypothetical protein KIS87_10855 [Phycisphaeraceae bacterium]|nr:hypothetical protein [Phycisphaeraceae bacterium]